MKLVLKLKHPSPKFMSYLPLYLMLLVPVTLVLLFKYLPMFGLVIAFKNYTLADGIFGSEWVGFKWFSKFLPLAKFWQVFRNTFLLSFYSLLYGFPAPIILAISINEVRNKAFKRFTQTVSYLPHFISTVVVVGMISQLLSPSTGAVNNLLKALGHEPVHFLQSAKWFRTIYVSSGIWQHVGWNSILYLAAITTIDPQLYEACIIDGGSRFRQIFHITIPGITPTIIILLLINLGRILEVGFEKVLLTYVPLTYSTADIISTYVYRRGIVDLDFGYSTAVGLFKSVVSFTLITGANKVARRFSETSLW